MAIFNKRKIWQPRIMTQCDFDKSFILLKNYVPLVHNLHWDILPDYYQIIRRNRSNSNYFSFGVIIIISCAFLYGSWYYTISMEENKHKTKEMDHLKQQLLNQQRYLTQLKDEINKLINYDKTGRADFALGRQGAKIVRLTDHTENYGCASSMVDGLFECDPPRGPNLMIHTDSSSGNCWAFKGVKGGVVIRLIGKVFIDSISIEHISKKLSPSGNLSSAPKDFTVWVLKTRTARLTLAIIPIIIDIGLSTVFGSGLIFATGIIYGMMALGKKASREDMAAVGSPQLATSPTGSIDGNADHHTTLMKDPDVWRPI